MKKPTPEIVVDQLLKDVELPKPTSVINGNPELGAAIKYFLELKAAGDAAAKHVTLSWFYEHKLRDEFDGPRYVGTVRAYVRKVLKLNPATGKPL